MPDKAGPPFEALDRHWRWWVTLFWLGFSAWLIFKGWAQINSFGLGDTDDNMRMMQVRGLLSGQGWYDLAQHRLAGSNIHWSRLVDLPIAAMKLLFTPFVGGRDAETIAVAVAPLLPMLVAMQAVAVMTRRLISPYAFLLAITILACSGSAVGMWVPMRIDHHGWQLAFLAWSAAALTDPRPLRSGVTLGLATALSFTIGMEMLPYLALAGMLAAGRWILDGEPRRLFAYGVSLAGGCCFGFLVFASEANWLPMCDALSPVWLSAMVAAGVVAILLAWSRPRSWQVRLGLALLGGAVIGIAFALTWPHCLGRLEQSTPELERLWLSKVREAMPIWKHGWDVAVLTLYAPIAGLIGGVAMLHVTHREEDREAFLGWVALSLLTLMGVALLFWQTRAGPAAQLLGATGAGAFAWIVLSWVMSQKYMIARVGGVFLIAMTIVGLAQGWFLGGSSEPLSAYRRSVNTANNLCPTLWALGPVNAQPAAMVMTFVDLGPRLITVTHHDAITGPYHRNATQIVDLMHAWRGTPQAARAMAEHYHVDYLLICPNMSESTIYRSEAPGGFYDQLVNGHVPAWLTPVPLPARSPYRMWRVIRPWRLVWQGFPAVPAAAPAPASTPAP